MAIVQLEDVVLGFGHPPVLDGAGLTVRAGDRLCIVGRNGAGKSTLLRLIDGQLAPDRGQVRLAAGTTVRMLPQETPDFGGDSVEDVVIGGLGDAAADWRLAGALQAGAEPGHERPADGVAQAAAAERGWALHANAERIFTWLGLDRGAPFARLSGGQQRRVLLARALIAEPDLLLLDEPTNHLDIDGVQELEALLTKLDASVVFVSHDRTFLRAVANRIAELDRGMLTSWDCGYAEYLRRREAAEEARAKADALFAKRLAAEESWIRQGIKARRTRNEGRVRRLQAMRETHGARRRELGKVAFSALEEARGSRLVARLRQVSFAWNERTVLRDVDLTIVRGDRVAIMGPNGCGKTTLLRMLLGELRPDSGQIRLGKGFEVAYFDQHREQLNEQATVMANVAEGAEIVTVGGRSRHVIGYLRDFLFEADRIRGPASVLSGGERNRLLLARLFTRPFDLLVMDEPTNDLDSETLELLEDQLLDYEGTLLLVSHDRQFVDNVATSTLVFEGDGRVVQYAGGYSDWLAQRPSPVRPPAEARGAPQAEAAARPRERAPRLGFRETRELAELPARIEAMEQELAEIQALFSDPDFFAKAGDRQAALQARMQELEAEIPTAWARWAKLDALPR